MDQGWIKLHRKLRDSWIYKDSFLVHLFIHLLIIAARDKQYVRIAVGRGYKIVALERGQALVGRNALAEDLGWSPSNVRNRMERLAKGTMPNGEDRLVDIKADSNESVVSILNYDVYQGNGDAERTAKGTAKGTGEGQAKDTHKKSKKPKNTSTPPGSGSGDSGSAPAEPLNSGVGCDESKPAETTAKDAKVARASGKTPESKSAPPPDSAAPPSPEAMAIWSAAFQRTYKSAYYEHGKDVERLSRVYARLGDADFRSRVAVYFSAPRQSYKGKNVHHATWLFESTINDYVAAAPAPRETDVDHLE